MKTEDKILIGVFGIAALILLYLATRSPAQALTPPETQYCPW